MTTRRPRKTRIYDANYRMGESTYKSALDDLDKKYAPKTSFTRYIKLHVFNIFRALHSHLFGCPSIIILVRPQES